MTETREQWIEREAREARARYWGSIGDWYSVQEHIRQDWRNVVAPYYPEAVADADTLEHLAEIGEKAYNADRSNLVDEKWISATKAILRAAKSEPLRVPVDVEGLADAIRRAEGHFGTWEDISESSKRGYLKCASAALAYLNIEPCAKPEYDPVDVAFRDALKRSQEIVNNWTPEQRNHNSIGYAGLQDNERNELENLRAECKRLRDCKDELLERREEQAGMLEEIKRLKHAYEVERDRANDLVADRNFAEAECKRLRSVVETAVSSIPYVAQSEDKTRLLYFINGENLVPKSALDESTAKAERQRQALDANRNAIESRGAEIAGLENEVKRLRTQRREWTEEDVEGLAKVLRVAHAVHFKSEPNAYWLDGFRTEARAALAWFNGKRGEA